MAHDGTIWHRMLKSRWRGFQPKSLGFLLCYAMLFVTAGGRKAARFLDRLLAHSQQMSTKFNKPLPKLPRNRRTKIKDVQEFIAYHSSHNLTISHICSHYLTLSSTMSFIFMHFDSNGSQRDGYRWLNTDKEPL